MTARPFMPLFVGDYLADTRDLNRSDHGGYMLLIMAYWSKGGPLPDDDNLLRRITLSTRYAWKKLRKNLQNFFTIRDGKWHHKRVDFELAKIKHKKDLADRNEAPQAPASRARGLRHNHNHKDYSAGLRLRRAEAEEPPPSPPPPDPVKEIFDRGLKILGPTHRSLLGEMRRDHGDEAVLEAVLATEREAASEPIEFFLGCLRRATRTRNGQDAKDSPVTKLYKGAYRAVEKIIERERRARAEGNHGASDSSLVPLLDCR